ncbi:hypothetical protein V6N00_12510 [Tersicoccus sp. MR15.9]|uniref:hypothetical protein n=1 Tax=Tersicoccus mangrovi TaxID=3121635 RepID=UPI002FE63346
MSTAPLRVFVATGVVHHDAHDPAELNGKRRTYLVVARHRATAALMIANTGPHDFRESDLKLLQEVWGSTAAWLAQSGVLDYNDDAVLAFAGLPGARVTVFAWAGVAWHRLGTFTPGLDGGAGHFEATGYVMVDPESGTSRPIVPSPRLAGAPDDVVTIVPARPSLDRDQFVDSIRQIVAVAAANNRASGFRDRDEVLTTGTPEEVLEHFALSLLMVTGEINEALDELRAGRAPDETYLGAGGKPEGFPTEIADAVIRCFDVADKAGFDLGAAIVQKLDYNRTRPYRHGKIA